MAEVGGVVTRCRTREGEEIGNGCYNVTTDSIDQCREECWNRAGSKESGRLGKNEVLGFT